MLSISQGDMQKVSYDTKLLPPGSPVRGLKKVSGVIVSPFFLKKKKAPPVSTFFVFSGTSHLFNLYLYYNSAYMPMQPIVDTFLTVTLLSFFDEKCAIMKYK